MENASKALTIAAEILIGVLLLTLLVFLFRAMGSFSNTVNSNIEAKNISEFNNPFEHYRGRNDITAQDIVTMGNLAKQYNNQMESTQIEVIVNGVSNIYHKAHSLNDKTTYEFIEDYSTIKKTTNGQTVTEIVYFKCKEMTYHNQTGRIHKIVLEKL